MNDDVLYLLREYIHEMFRIHARGYDIYHQAFMTNVEGYDSVRVSIGGREFDYITVDFTRDNLPELMATDIKNHIFGRIVDELRSHDPVKSYEDLWEYEMVELDGWSPEHTKMIINEEHEYFIKLANVIESEIM